MVFDFTQLQWRHLECPLHSADSPIDKASDHSFSVDTPVERLHDLISREVASYVSVVLQRHQIAYPGPEGWDFHHE